MCPDFIAPPRESSLRLQGNVAVDGAAGMNLPARVPLERVDVVRVEAGEVRADRVRAIAVGCLPVLARGAQIDAVLLEEGDDLVGAGRRPGAGAALRQLVAALRRDAGEE